RWRPGVPPQCLETVPEAGANPRFSRESRASGTVSYWGRSEAFTLLGRDRGALPDRDRAVDLDDHGEPTLRLGRIGTLLRLGERTGAAAETDELAKGGSAATVYRLARVYAVASKDTRGATEPGNPYAARAVELLRRAVRKGYQDLAGMRKDAALDPLRSRDDF